MSFGGLPFAVSPDAAPDPTASPVPAAPALPVVPTTNPIQAIADASAQQQQAARDEGAAKLQAGQDEAAAQDYAQAKAEAQAVELQKTQERHARALDDAHNQTEAALKNAQSAHIPDFFEGQEGKRTEAAIWRAIGAAGATLAGGPNYAGQIIDQSIDAYHRRQKENIDNLYKFAAAKREGEDDLRSNQARELSDLEAKYGAVKLAVAAKIDKQAALGKGRIDAAAANALSSKYAMEGQEAILRAKDTLSQINYRAAEAARQRRGEGDAKAAANEEKEIKPVEAIISKEETRLKGSERAPGPIRAQVKARELGDTIRNAYASGDQQALAAALIAAKETLSRLNTGAAPSSKVMGLFNSLQGVPQEAEAKLKQLLGDPNVSHMMAEGMLKFVDQSDESLLKQVDTARSGMIRTMLAKDVGVARTPAQRRHALGRIEGLFGDVTSRGGAPRYQEGGAPATSAAAPPARSFTPQDDEALAWANANPKDPRAAQIHAKQGR